MTNLKQPAAAEGFSRRDMLRTLGGAAAAVGAASFLAACGSSGAAPAAAASASGTGELLAKPGQPFITTTVAASSTSVNHMWAQWGVKHGYYKKYGLNVQTEGNVANAVAAMAAGKLDFSASGVATQSGAVQGAPVKVAMVTFRDNLGVYGLPGIKSVQDLKGKRILGPDDMIKAILQKNGINGDTGVTWVTSNASTQQSIQMVKQGRADAFTGYPPAVFLAEQAGLVQVTSVADVFPGSPVSIVGTSTHLMQASPLLVKKFLAGTLDALADMKANKAAVVQFFQTSWGFSPSLAEQTYTVIPRDMFRNGQTDDSALQQVLDVTEKAQGKSQQIPLGQVWDFTLLRQVLAGRNATGA
jgi:ABC-type nitrate/sulfonate/bicarbonate transport system substrate-binding protein